MVEKALRAGTALLAAWVSMLGSASFAAQEAAKAPAYSVVELKMEGPADSGFSVHALSENDSVAGSFGNWNNTKPFLFAGGKFVDLPSIPKAGSITARLSEDGVLILLVEAPGKGGPDIQGRIMMYKDGKLKDITPPGEQIHELRPPNSRGEFIVSTARGEYILCSTESPVQRRVSADFVVAPGTVAGWGIQNPKQRILTLYIEKNGVKSWMAGSEAYRGGPGRPRGLLNEADLVNSAGDFVVGTGPMCIVNAGTRKIKPVAPPLGKEELLTKCHDTSMDDAGVVAGEAYRGTFVYEDGTTTFLKELVPGAVQLCGHSRTGYVVGLLENRHLFYRKDKKVVDLGAVAGNTAKARVNRFGQILATVNDAATKKNKVYLSHGTGLIDLDTFRPEGADYEFSVAGMINDHGVIVAQTEFKKGQGQRFFVLYPKVPNVLPATSAPAASAPAATTRAK